MLLLFAVFAVLADFLSPYDPAAQHRESPYAPPVWPRWPGRPFVYATQLADRARMSYVEERSRKFPLRFFVAGEEYRWLGLLPCRHRLFGVDEPARIFLLGTDALGRDVFSRLLHGARLSLLIAAGSLLIAFPLAVFAGSVAGFYGGALDFGLMRLIELFLALPALYLVIALRSALPLSLAPEKVFMALTMVIALFGWAYLARVVRGLTLSLRERDFVRAAVALGASDWRVIRHHILPHLTGVTLTQAAIAAPGYMLAEVTLSYLGLGVPEPMPSWGNMLASAQSIQTLGTFWWNLAPAGAIFAVSFAFHLLAEGLRLHFDPRAQEAEAAQQLW